MADRDIAIIDSGGANIASLMYALERQSVSATVTTDAGLIASAGHVILPGVGAARDAMQRLSQHGLIDVIRGLKQPVLGICLGMQLLAEASEEEDVECLGLIPGTVRRLRGDPTRPVPNMGWCRVASRGEHELLTDIADGAWFYFLHSYALPVSAHTLASAEHTEPFTAVVARQNFVATQFHPERSSAAGARLLANFLGMQA